MASASQWAWGSYCEVVSVGRLTQGDYWEVVNCEAVIARWFSAVQLAQWG